MIDDTINMTPYTKGISKGKLYNTEVSKAFGFPSKDNKFQVRQSGYKNAILNQIQKIDVRQAINRYTWYNLPKGLNQELLERMLYYRGQIMFFYMPTVDTFYALPYALDGDIDVYGQYITVTPLPFTGKLEVTNKDEKQKAWIQGLTRNVVYDFLLPEEVTEDVINNGCVLLFDYCKEWGQILETRWALNKPLIERQAEALPLARTNLIANSGVTGVRVQDADAYAAINRAIEVIEQAALNGSPYLPIESFQEFQELTANKGLDVQSFLMYFQALDNFRLQTYGIGEGVFEKKEHMLGSEYEQNIGNSGLVYQDGLRLRQDFCNKVNAIWGLGIWCEPSENVIGDKDMDGYDSDEVDQSGQTGNSIPNEMVGDDDE